MGKKKNPESVMKISKNHRKQHHHHEKKQFNSLINVLRPKVYITDSSTFKSLVQQLTGLNADAAAAAIDHHDDRISSSSSSLSSPLLSPETQLLDHDHDHHKVSIIDIDHPSPLLSPETQLLDHDHDHHKVSIIDIDHPDDHYTDESNSCMEATASSDYASVDSFHHEHITSRCNMQQLVSYTEEVKQLSAYDNHDQMYYENQLDHDQYDINSEFILMNQQHQHQQQEKDFWDNYDFESWLLDMEPCPNISYNGCYSQIQQEVSIYDYELPAVI